MTRLVLVLALPMVVAFAAFKSAHALVDEPVRKSTERPTGLLWSERVFLTQSSFEAFLRARGLEYRTWAVRHPAGAPWKAPIQRAAAAQPKVGARGAESVRTRAIETTTRLLPLVLLVGACSILVMLFVRIWRALVRRRRSAKWEVANSPTRSSSKRRRRPARSRGPAVRVELAPNPRRPTGARITGAVASGELLGQVTGAISRATSRTRWIRENAYVTRSTMVTYGVGAIGSGCIGILVAYLAAS